RRHSARSVAANRRSPVRAHRGCHQRRRARRHLRALQARGRRRPRIAIGRALRPVKGDFMISRFIHSIIVALTAACALAVRGTAAAQAPFPDRPIKLIVPFTPGTGIDILARTLGQRMGEDWSVGVVVDNRPGASGNIGTEAVAKSPPDGYTLLTTASTI